MFREKTAVYTGVSTVCGFRHPPRVLERIPAWIRGDYWTVLPVGLKSWQSVRLNVPSCQQLGGRECLRMKPPWRKAKMRVGGGGGGGNDFISFKSLDQAVSEASYS